MIYERKWQFTNLVAKQYEVLRLWPTGGEHLKSHQPKFETTPRIFPVGVEHHP